jgi:hypothetical protein
MSPSPAYIDSHGATTLAGGRRRSQSAPIAGVPVATRTRRRDRLAGHRYTLPVVRELPRSYVRDDDATW